MNIDTLLALNVRLAILLSERDVAADIEDWRWVDEIDYNIRDIRDRIRKINAAG